jgi:RNA polymerase sigma factor for flagellar operon FliA
MPAILDQPRQGSRRGPTWPASGPAGDTVPTDTDALWRAYRRDPTDAPAYLALVEAYLPLVARALRRLSIQVQTRVDPRELIGSGVQGLHQAIRRYVPERKVPFDRFAESRIRGAILDDLRGRDPLTRRQRQGVRQVLTAIAEHLAARGSLPSHRDIAVRTSLSEGEIECFLGLGAATVNLEQEFCAGLRYMDVIADSGALTPAEEADRRFAAEALEQAIRKLPERDQQLLFLRHHEQLGVKEIAAALRVTPGRVSQMYNEIVARLRTLMKTDV